MDARAWTGRNSKKTYITWDKRLWRAIITHVSPYPLLSLFHKRCMHAQAIKTWILFLQTPNYYWELLHQLNKSVRRKSMFMYVRSSTNATPVILTISRNNLIAEKTIVKQNRMQVWIEINRYVLFALNLWLLWIYNHPK